MRNVITLIDMGRVKCGTDAELGRRIGASRSQIADFRSGKKSLSPETVAALCDVLELPGDEAREWVAVTIIDNPKNSSRAEMLRRALFACWALGVAALMQPKDAMAMTAASTSTTTTEQVSGYRKCVDSLYIVAHLTEEACISPA